MPPRIKVYKIPTNASGIVGNGNIQDSLDDSNNTDLYYNTIFLYPVNQAKDYENTPTTQHQNESPHYLKAKLTPVSSDDYETKFVCNLVGISGKRWMTNKHPNVFPRVYLNSSKYYFEDEAEAVFSFTYVPRYNEDKNENYIVDPSGFIEFSEDFVQSCADGEFLYNNQGAVSSTPAQAGVHAEFWYIDNTTEDQVYMAASGDFCEMTNCLVEVLPYNETSWYAIQGNGVVTPSGQSFNRDVGYLEWAGPSGIKVRVTGWQHTWDRLFSDEMFDLSFLPGEKSPNGIASNSTLVRDFTPSHPWYIYQDIKIINESLDSSLEKFCIYPSVRGILENGLIKTGFEGLQNIEHPWDQQEGTAIETVGYEDEFDTGAGKYIFTVMCWEFGNGTNDYQNFCQPSGISDDAFLGKRFSFRDKFPYPPNVDVPTTPTALNPNKGVGNVIKFFHGTVPDPIGDISFIKSKHVTQSTTQYLWTQTSNADRMIIPSGTIALDGRPRPGGACARLLWTYRTFNETTGKFNDAFQSNINETIGEKVFSIKIAGKYYED